MRTTVGLMLTTALLSASNVQGGHETPKESPPSAQEKAREYFDEIETLCRKDDSRLWGRSLAGPVLFADPKTRRVFANQADAEGRLKKEGSIFVGELPATVHVANYSVRWAGVQWTMVRWPLPNDANTRRVLMMHESWHRIQGLLGLPATGPENAHLDRFDGRYWLQLEWRALARALADRGDNQRQAIADALAFRQERRRLTKDVAVQERQLEMHEGMAEYSGVALSGMNEEERRRYVIKLLENRPATYPSFARSFAYLSGPAYGLLLDQADDGWTKRAKLDMDLGDSLQKALKLTPPKLDAEALGKRAKFYDGERLLAKETEREQARVQRQAALKKRFVDGPVLTLPLKKVNISFDPNTLEPLDGVGTYYPTARITDQWGTLEVTGGAVRAADFKSVRVTAPKETNGNPLKGDGWELKLSDGWRIVPGKRPGDFWVEPN